jgi:hypothetical protein
MSSALWWSGIVRVTLVTAGLIGLFLAADALFLSVLIVISAVLGGNLNPYAGLFLFIVVPVLVAVGGGAAWTAYRLWQRVPRRSAAEAGAFVLRT